MLQWKDISLHFSLCLFFGGDYLVYFALSIFRHMGPIDRSASATELLFQIQTAGLADYDGLQQLDFMKELRERHGGYCRGVMQVYISNLMAKDD